MLRTRLWLVGLWTLVIIALSLAPNNQFNNKGVYGIDKVVHAFFYAVHVFLLVHAFLRQRQYSNLNEYGWIWALICSSILGLSIEIIQGTVFVYRQVEIFDVVANVFGICIGIGSFYLIFGKLKTQDYGRKKE